MNFGGNEWRKEYIIKEFFFKFVFVRTAEGASSDKQLQFTISKSRKIER